MNASQDERDDPDVSREEALQGQRAQIRAAAQGFEDEIADQRHTPRDLGADRGGPVRTLVPREQVAGESPCPAWQSASRCR